MHLLFYKGDSSYIITNKRDILSVNNDIFLEVVNLTSLYRKGGAIYIPWMKDTAPLRHTMITKLARRGARVITRLYSFIHNASLGVICHLTDPEFVTIANGLLPIRDVYIDEDCAANPEVRKTFSYIPRDFIIKLSNVQYLKVKNIEEIQALISPHLYNELVKARERKNALQLQSFSLD